MIKRLNQKSKKNRTWLFIGGGLAVIVILIGLFFGYNYWQQEQRRANAQAKTHEFVDTIEKQDYARLTSFLSPSSLEAIEYTSEQVEERYEIIYGGINASDLKIENIQVAEDENLEEFKVTYDLKMTTSLGELPVQSYETTLSEIEDDFLVDWDTSLIFPAMDEGDTIQITTERGKRGNILDRTGELLAGEVAAWEAGLYPALLGEGESRQDNLETIAEQFNTSIDYLENLLAAQWVTEDSFVPIQIVSEENRPPLTGVVYQETKIRAYPLEEAGAHLIGYTGEVSAEDIENDPSLAPGDTIGKSGLEATFEERLRSETGGKLVILNEDGEEKEVLQESPPAGGEDIRITIDRELQQQYYERFEEENGAAVVAEPETGELLVLTSSPSYDPLAMAQGISAEAYQTYADDENAPFLPRYTARYAPGSTFKGITGAIGLDSGVTTTGKTHEIIGYEWQKDETWGDHMIRRVQNQPQEVDLEAAYVYSDNIFFAKEALEMGAQKFKDGLEQFPFGETFDLPIHMNPAQITNSQTFDNERLLADTAYGQGQLLLSPLHQVAFYSSIANGGQLVFPVLEQGTTPRITQPISSEAAEIVNNALVQVVENPNGTAHLLNSSSIQLAAKTGTTETESLANEGTMDINGSLLVYDAENKSYLSVILVEDAEGVDVVRQFAPIFE